MTLLHYVVFGYFGIMNLVLFLLMGADKWKAKRGVQRVPEATLLGLGVIGGGFGGFAGMFLFRHKTRKFYFHAAFFVGVAVMCAAFYF